MSDTTAGDEREALAEALWRDLADHWDGRVVGASLSQVNPDLRYKHYDTLDRLLAAGWRRDGVDRECTCVQLPTPMGQPPEVEQDPTCPQHYDRAALREQLEKSFPASWAGFQQFITWHYPEGIFPRGSEDGPAMVRVAREIADLKVEIDRLRAAGHETGDQA